MVPYFINTKEELENLIQKLEKLQKSQYDLKNNWEQALNEIFTQQEKEYIKTYSKNYKDNTNAVTKLINYLQKARVVNITLAWQPTIKQQLKIAQKIKSLIKEGVINIYYNPDIAGGIVLEYKGKYLDLSLKNKYEAKL